MGCARTCQSANSGPRPVGTSARRGAAKLGWSVSLAKRSRAQGVTQVVWLGPDPVGVPEPRFAEPRPQSLADLGLADSQTVPAGKPLLLISDGPRQTALPPTGASAAPLLHLRLSRKPAPAGAAQLVLAPLPKDACLSILEELVDPSLRLVTTSLVGETGGNPAYTIELGRTLSNARTGSFSGSLTSLLQARLDLLPQAQRYLLAQLALVGERSWTGLAAHLTAHLADVRDADIEALCGEALLVKELYSSLPGETELRFRSELLRRAALLTVPLSERRVCTDGLPNGWPRALQASLRHFQTIISAKAAPTPRFLLCWVLPGQRTGKRNFGFSLQLFPTARRCKRPAVRFTQLSGP